MNEDTLKKLSSIENNDLNDVDLIDTEKEIALKILNNLEGTLVVRAIPILEFCLKAIKYTEFDLKSF